MANGRHLKVDPDEVTVNEIAGAFWEHAQGHYRRADGSPIQGSLDGYKRALALLRRLYGTVPAASFGPIALRCVQQEMVRMGWARCVVNQRVNLIRAVFRWAAGRKTTSASVGSLEAAIAAAPRELRTSAFARLPPVVGEDECTTDA